jgi:hypothetical protein
LGAATQTLDDDEDAAFALAVLWKGMLSPDYLPGRQVFPCDPVGGRTVRQRVVGVMTLLDGLNINGGVRVRF